MTSYRLLTFGYLKFCHSAAASSKTELTEQGAVAQPVGWVEPGTVKPNNIPTPQVGPLVGTDCPICTPSP